MSSAVCNLTQLFQYPNIPLVISFCERKSTYLWYFGKYLYRNADCCNSCHLRHSSSSFSQFKRQKLQRYFTQTKLVQEFNNRDSSYLIASRDCTRRKSSEYFRMLKIDDESVQITEVVSSNSLATSPSMTERQTVTKIDDSMAAASESRTAYVRTIDFPDEDTLMTSSSSATSPSLITPSQTETIGGVSMSEVWKVIQPRTDLVKEFSENSITNTMKSELRGEEYDDGDIVRPLALRKWPNTTGGVLAGTQSSVGLPVGRISSLEAETESDGDMIKEAWQRLKNSIVYFNGLPVGTLAALDPNADALNYNQVFVRDFVPVGLAYLMKKEPQPDIVKNFILNTLDIQGWKKRIDEFTLGEGVMPASFKVLKDHDGVTERLVADFGGSAIGRVAPVDAGFWWIILLRAYWKCTGDRTLICLEKVQEGMKRILQHSLSNGFDTYPTLLCADGCSMIDRRMGIYGYPIEIQALFHFAMRCALEMILINDKESRELIERINQRVTALSFHIRKYYWLDFSQLNSIYRYKTEEYSQTAVNKFNVIPDSIPDWVFDFMTMRGGYLIGNVSPARMDFRWFVAGNCIAIFSSLATTQQKSAIMDLIEDHFEDLIGEMPLKVTYPAQEGHDWRILTGSDPKNTRWSCHNGGSWPVLLWLFTAACIKVGRPHLAKMAIEKVELRLAKDGWPEYYDGKTGRLVGKQARKYQTWSIAGYLVAKMLIENPANLSLISIQDDKNKEIAALNRAQSCSAFPSTESMTF